MTLRKEDLHRLVERLQEQDQKTVYDFMRYLIDRQKDPYDEINRREPDDVPLNKEELEQFNDEEYISWEDVKRELKL